MPFRKEKFVNGGIYHLILRGIDNNLLFKNIDDHYRGIFCIYEFNHDKRVEIRDKRRARMKIKEEVKRVAQKFEKEKARGQRVSADLLTDPRDKLVEVLAFCLMPNHVHLLVRQLKNDGITKFMRKLGAGYGRYFNKKYQRKGYVFQNRFKAVCIKNDEQLKIVLTYIHANPASLIEPKWKEKGIRSLAKIIKFLGSYKWSSYQDYIGGENFPSVTGRKFSLDTIGGQNKCKEFLIDYLKYKGKIKEFPDFVLE